MGCDIHIVLERKEPGAEWVGLWASDCFPAERPRIARRDYDFFSEVANVRGRSATGLFPRNVPKDVSRLAWLQYMRSPTDHHSASHLSLDEFAAAYRRANPEAEFRDAFSAHDLFGVDTTWPEGCEYRVVFWFDN